MNATINAEDILIRTQLLPGDIGYAAYLHGWLYAEECGYNLNFESFVLEGLSEFSRQYDPEKDRVWVCEHQKKIVGFLVGFRREDTVQLRYFILVPDYRGFGLGRKLMDMFVDYMKEQGVNKAFLLTTHEQQAAISLYTRYGFRLTEEKTSQEYGKFLIIRRYDLNISNT